jgi:hypothetical protein
MSKSRCTGDIMRPLYADGVLDPSLKKHARALNRGLSLKVYNLLSNKKYDSDIP